MGKHIDIGYFKKKIKVRSKVAKTRTFGLKKLSQ